MTRPVFLNRLNLRNMFLLPKFKKQKGQTVLIILLIVAVILTVGLAAISSSISDIKVTQQTEEASRAFYVAESALEEHLLSPLGAQESGTIGDVDYVVSRLQQGGNEFLFPFKAESNDPQIFWLIGHDDQGEMDLATKYSDSSISLYWTDSDSGETPALAVAYVYNESGVYKVSRYNFDPDGERIGDNHFDPASSGSFSLGEKTFKYTATISDLEQGALIQPYFLKLTLLYNSTPQLIGVKPNGSSQLPNQGYCFVSTATVAQSGITRKIKQCKLWQGLPAVFQWGLFSGGSLEKSD